jgi:branched-chain amino acid transport system permease protein
VIEFSTLWGGLTVGSFYGLLGLSYLLIFRATQTLNFGVGAFAVFAAIAAATWANTFGVVPATLAALAVACLGALASDTLVARPIQAREGGHFAVVIALTAVFFAIVQLTGQWLTPTAVLAQPVIDMAFFDGQVSGQSAVLVATSVAATIASWIWFKHGRKGRLLTAVADDWYAAILLCLPIRWLRILVVLIGGLAAGVAGILVVGLASVSFYSGFAWALIGLVAMMLGGSASAWGPLVGGVVVGLVETLSARWIGASVQDYVLLAVVLLVFLLRPQGLFASRSVRA